MVTPKEVDLVIDGFSKIISKSINIGIQPNLDVEEINKFIASHDVLKVEHFNGEDYGDINTMVTYRKSANDEEN